MLKQKDILVAVKDKILSFDPEAVIYHSETIEGYSRPCYFVDILPIDRTMEMANIYNISLMVVITYFSNTKNSLENMEVSDNIFEQLQGILRVKDRNLTISKFSIDKIGDDNMEFNVTFDLNFKDSLSKDENSTIAKEVFINFKEG